MEVPSSEHSNPFFMFEVSQVCATCTNLLTGKCYSLDTLVDQTANVNFYQVLVLQCQFKCEENGPSNICKECFSKILLFYEFHQKCKNSVMLFSKYVEWQKQCIKPDIVDLGMCDTDAISTNIKQEQDVKVTIDIEETVISESTWMNPNNDFNFLREIKSAEGDMSCNSNESIKSNMLKEKFKQNKLYECTECDATYDNPKSLLYHRNIHDKKFLCSYCGKANGSSVRLKLHERTHTGELPYPCGNCDKRFLSNSLLTQHQSTHTQERPFKCEVCAATFKDRPTLARHIHRHIGNKQHKCTVCNKRFIRSSDLKRHLQVHEKVADKGENVESISLHSKSSSQDEETNQQPRESNMLNETTKQDKLYKCTECDATYDKYISFFHHKTIHTKKFVCTYCGKSKGSQYALGVHERTHTGEYPCRKCAKQFKSNAELAQHLLTHSKKITLNCTICEKTFSTRSALSRHIHIHKGIKRHKCTQCDARFVQSCDLKRHLQTHEKVADQDENEEIISFDVVLI